MGSIIAYSIAGLIAFLEGGELTVLLASFLARFSDLDVLVLATILVVAFFVSDLFWYRFGEILYTLPIFKNVEPMLENLDRRIKSRPFMVALVARFSYGIHHATVARYRRNGISLNQMILYLLGTLSVWLIVIGMVVEGLTLLSPEVGGVFRYMEYMFTLGFVLFFLMELGVSARIRRLPNVLGHAYEFFTLLFVRVGRSIRYFYSTLLAVLFVLTVSTPVMVREGFGFLTEEAVEVLILTTLGIIGLVTYRSYEHQLHAVQDTLLDMSKHVGALNLQTVQLETMFRKFNRLPENRRELTQLLAGLNANILAAVDVPWVLTRIIDTESGRTLTEYYSLRETAEQVAEPAVSNKALLGLVRPRGYYVYRSEHQNLPVRAACAVPRHSMNHHQELVVRTAINSLAMVYLVFQAQGLSVQKEVHAKEAGSAHIQDPETKDGSGAMPQ